MEDSFFSRHTRFLILLSLHNLMKSIKYDDLIQHYKVWLDVVTGHKMTLYTTHVYKQTKHLQWQNHNDRSASVKVTIFMNYWASAPLTPASCHHCQFVSRVSREVGVRSNTGFFLPAPPHSTACEGIHNSRLWSGMFSLIWKPTTADCNVYMDGRN